MKTLKVLLVLAVLGLAAGAGFIYSGIYNVAADEPHRPLTFKLFETLRERSIGARAKGIEVPNLDDPKRVSEGAEHYSAMCMGCHLAPGMEDTEIRAGLYPQPPNLAEHEHAKGDATGEAARQFWIIKHGIKMTAMPAWGMTHDDPSLWGLVAFLRKLPDMTAEEYATLTGAEGRHDHGGEAAPTGDARAPGTPPHGHGESQKAEESHQDHSHAH